MKRLANKTPDKYKKEYFKNLIATIWTIPLEIA
jgi:hypothetical protein